jgi:lipoate---protein ligase
MRFLNYSFEEPAKNLALEEVLLNPFINHAECEPIIRVWENKTACVVIGRGEEINKQVYLGNARKEDVTVLRRISGGGTVLHGEGNLNVSFFLPYTYCSGLENIKESYCVILKWVCHAIEKCSGVMPVIKGTCDLVLNDKKVSGTAQSRKRYGLLHHLTLLWKLDFPQCERILKEPEKRPEYRMKRSHSDFVTTFEEEKMNITQQAFIEALKNQFDGVVPYELSQEELGDVERLYSEKYNLDTWNQER